MGGQFASGALFNRSDAETEGKDANNAPLLEGVLWAEAGIATLVVMARIGIKLRRRKPMWWDDYLMILAVVVDYIALAVLMVSCSYGLGRHQDMLQPKDRVNALLWQWIAQPIELTAMMLGRISICVMLIRLFPTKIWLARFLVTITALGVVFTVLPSAMIFSCRPVQAMWDESLDGWCPDPKIQVSFALTKAAISAVTDFTVALWPILIIWKLQMQIRIKVSLCVIFALSLFAMAGSIAEAFTLDNLAVRDDTTYQIVYVFIWMWTQTHLVIILGSLPALRPLFSRKSREPPRFEPRRPAFSFTRRSRRVRQPTHLFSYDTGVGLGPQYGIDNQVTAGGMESGASLPNVSENRSGSEDTILPAANRVAAGAPRSGEVIHKTTEMDVTYERR